MFYYGFHLSPQYPDVEILQNMLYHAHETKKPFSVTKLSAKIWKDSYFQFYHKDSFGMCSVTTLVCKNAFSRDCFYAYV